mmetsp:Transcript_8919/g.11212  ORF Transcript_8919/g.11212 Transcript_8919/m.11212 type:complete len:704 (-) Transcript_8919:1366-3477(-)
MGQENEAHAELIATIQHDHVPMKKWYNTSTEATSLLHAKYGSTYPSFWRDVIQWDGWKETRKLFLKSTESPSGGATSTTTSSATSSNTAASQQGGQRKRRSRWASSTDNSNGTTENNTEPPKRKSRWAKSADAATERGRDQTPKPVNSVLDILPGLPSNLDSAQSVRIKELQKTLRGANQRLENLEQEAARIDALPVGHPDRSPSPPPVYGVDGKRKNTRAVRWRERYTSVRQDTLEEILSLATSSNNASVVAPSLFTRKRTRKIHIPVEDHPTYNFIGLIIGPRGKTQKEMESKTNCKIAIRGKGSVKEGAKGRRDGKMLEGDNEPLHVVITGESQVNVDAAADMITQLLVVIDDDKNVRKQEQLRELALLNGTLKEDEYCPLCAEKGHKAFECPQRFSMNKNSATVKCAICGDTSHPTRDCKLNKDGTCTVVPESSDGGKADKELDSDYLAFMNELDGKAAGEGAPAPKTISEDDRKQLASLVTTIEKTVDGVTVCTPISINKSNTERSGDAATGVTPISTTVTSVTNENAPLITTISSRIVKAAPPDPVMPPMMMNAVPPVPTTSTSIPSIHTSANVNNITGMSSAVGSVPPPPPALNASLPPPPSSIPPPPPPPPTTSHFGQQHHQQQPMGAYYQQQPNQQQQQYTSYNAGYPGHPQQNASSYGHATQQQPGWDYRNYYGSSNTGGDADGAGGFNWWES